MQAPPYSEVPTATSLLVGNRTEKKVALRTRKLNEVVKRQRHRRRWRSASSHLCHRKEFRDKCIRLMEQEGLFEETLPTWREHGHPQRGGVLKGLRLGILLVFWVGICIGHVVCR